MTYSITAMSSVGGVALKRDSAAAALKKARELRQDGYVGVLIVDGSTGVKYDEDSLARAVDSAAD